MHATLASGDSATRGIRLGTSAHTDPGMAAEALATQLSPTLGGLSVVFASSRYDADRLSAGLRNAFAGSELIGCTTAGEIGPAGYQEASLTGACFHPDDLDFELALLENLDQIEARQMVSFAQGLRTQLLARRPGLSAEHCFAFMLVDGLSGLEESVARAFHDGLGGIPLSGGSAGDDLRFSETRVIYRGRLVRNAAVLLVARSRRPFRVFKTQHFEPTEARLVVTGAIPERRIVTEINGCPAATEYARAVGLDPNHLAPQVFASRPVVVRIGNADFVRSIQRANPDGSLSFFCAIDRGIVFKLAKGQDLLANLERTLAQVSAEIGPPDLILGCDCILRLLECRERNITAAVGARLAAHHVIGFSTFGEQYRGMHINQTFTGVAFGGRPAP